MASLTLTLQTELKILASCSISERSNQTVGCGVHRPEERIRMNQTDKIIHVINHIRTCRNQISSYRRYFCILPQNICMIGFEVLSEKQTHTNTRNKTKQKMANIKTAYYKLIEKQTILEIPALFILKFKFQTLYVFLSRDHFSWCRPWRFSVIMEFNWRVGHLFGGLRNRLVLNTHALRIWVVHLLVYSAPSLQVEHCLGFAGEHLTE